MSALMTDTRKLSVSFKQYPHYARSQRLDMSQTHYLLWWEYGRVKILLFLNSSLHKDSSLEPGLKPLTQSSLPVVELMQRQEDITRRLIFLP
ncbi:hypothetical protein RRG08_055472 [Elysia crispata]|uniref:Uncharacterized protein n=1 Tax=Elysia crispata TaxID=231223 RepID=A0AAE1DIB7_9GAST|nr:hypothetical protein RRG08_055472 [Elysia crispata]